MTTPNQITPKAGAVLRSPPSLPSGVVLYGQEYTKEYVEEIYSGASGGIQTIERYRGDPSAISILKDQLRKDGIRYRFADVIPGELEVYRDEQIGGDGGATVYSYIVETWDLDWVEVNVRLAYAPLFQSAGVVDMGVLRTERYIDSFDPDTSTPWQSIDFNARYTSTLANTYRNKRAAGITDWQIFRPVLIQRLTAATSAELAASNVGINQVWRVSPHSTLNKLGDLKSWSFRKLPARKTLWAGKVTVEQRYDGAGSWDPDLYPPYTA